MSLTSKTKHFMCYDCQDATSVVNNPTGWGVHLCQWCKKMKDGTYVSNKPPLNSFAAELKMYEDNVKTGS